LLKDLDKQNQPLAIGDISLKSTGNGSVGNQRVPFDNNSTGRKKRSVSVTSGIQPGLAFPTATPAKAPVRQTIQANPPIPQKVMKSEDLEKMDFSLPPDFNVLTTPAPLDTRPMRYVTNSPDLSNQPIPTQLPKIENVEMRVSEPASNNPFSERLALPSRGIFYNFGDIQIRPFEAADLAALFKANRKRDMILFYDVISRTINVDIRDLWIVDVKRIMYWHRINSFPKTPFFVNWTSLYGNENKTKIDFSVVNSTPLTMTREKYMEWQEKGFKCPSLRDEEHYDSFRGNLEEDEQWLYEKAAYLQGKDLHEQRKRFNDPEAIDLIYQVAEFRQEIGESDIIETATVKDVKFKHDDALEKLTQELEVANVILATELDLTEEQEQLIVDRKTKVETEIHRLKASNPGEAEPVLETITLRLNVLDFFPNI
jgi:hypothetical protein